MDLIDWAPNCTNPACKVRPRPTLQRVFTEIKEGAFRLNLYLRCPACNRESITYYTKEKLVDSAMVDSSKARRSGPAMLDDDVDGMSIN